MSSHDPELLKRAAAIRLLVLDVDGVLTDGRLYFDNNGLETKTFHTRDGFGIKTLQRNGIEVAVITGRKSEIVSQRMQHLQVEHVYQGRDDKLNAFNQLLDTTGFKANEVCYAGDDWLDLPVLVRAGLAVTVADADEYVKQHVHWITQRKGGEGAVREICNLLLKAQGKDRPILNGFLAL